MVRGSAVRRLKTGRPPGVIGAFITVIPVRLTNAARTAPSPRRRQMVGNAGAALLFFMYLVGMTIIGLYVAAYAAHSFLTAVEDTAAGNDEVRWPHDPLVDWAWKLFYLVWLAAVWLVPALV